MAIAKPKKTYNKPAKNFSAKKKAAQLKQLLVVVVVGSVLLGGLALAFANTRKSHDVRSDASENEYACQLRRYKLTNTNCGGGDYSVLHQWASNSNEANSCKVSSENGTSFRVKIVCFIPTNSPSAGPTNPTSGPNPTSAVAPSSPPAGSDDEKIIVGGTVYACDGSRLANVPVKAFGNTVTTNNQGKWEIRKNTQIIANGIAEFTVVAGASIANAHPTHFSARASTPQFPKVNANCTKINCNYIPSSAAAGRGYSVNQYQFGTNLAEYRRWFVTSTASPNPFTGFDFKPVDCGNAQRHTLVNMYAAKNHSDNAFYVTASVQPIPGRTIQKVVISHRKVGGGWLGSVNASFANGVWWHGFSGTQLERGQSYQFTANVHYTQGLPCTGDQTYTGAGYDKCVADTSKPNPRTVSLPVIHN